MTIEDIALQFTKGVGGKTTRHLLDVFGSAEAIFSVGKSELMQRAEIREDIAQNIVSKGGFAPAEREIKHCIKNNIIALASTDEHYPKLLKECDDSPHVIYIKGSVEALNMRSLSIVGTREATPYGLTMCERLVEGLSERVPNLSIVSGLAYGIDVAAHRAALAHKLTTVAVVANALPDVKPSPHHAIAEQILRDGGALLSEASSQTKDSGRMFVPRNRIIAALSSGTLVVESGYSGGSIHTAQFASSYNRVVMAVPGRVTDKCSVGTNTLIRNREAQLVLSVEDIIRELMWDLDADVGAKPKAQPTRLTNDELKLLELIPQGEAIAIELIFERSDLDMGAVSALLIGMELDGVVRQLPGNRYIKL